MKATIFLLALMLMAGCAPRTPRTPGTPSHRVPNPLDDSCEDYDDRGQMWRLSKPQLVGDRRNGNCRKHCRCD